MFSEYDPENEQIVFFKNKDKECGSSLLIKHEFIFHIPPKMDIWRYEAYLK